MKMTRHTINSDASILEAMDRLNQLSGGAMILFVTDADGRLLGTLTDGDVRRGLLGGARLEDEVARVMHRDFKALTGESIDVARLREYRHKNLRLIPRIDSEGRILEVVDTAVTPTRLPLSAILMAGGKGERLRPMTLTCPKPLLKIGDKAIIDYNVDAMIRAGITNIVVTTNYLAEQLEAHFAEPRSGVKVQCIKEQFPMGTIGAASLADLPESGATLVMNSDLLTNISLEDMFLTHLEAGAAVTIAAIPYNVSVPYAILTTDGNRVRGLEEKPSYSYYANAGIYIIDNALLRALPRDSRTDATDLVEQAIAAGKMVTYFPISGSWIDIGTPTDFKHAQELMKHKLDELR